MLCGFFLSLDPIRISLLGERQRKGKISEAVKDYFATT